MPRFVLRGSEGWSRLIVEAPSEHDALLWGYRHPAEVAGFAGGIESEDAYFARTHGQFVESFRRRYESEGASPEEAARQAEAAAGSRPRLRVVQVGSQAPMPRSGREAGG